MNKRMMTSKEMMEDILVNLKYTNGTLKNKNLRNSISFTLLYNSLGHKNLLIVRKTVK